MISSTSSSSKADLETLAPKKISKYVSEPLIFNVPSNDHNRNFKQLSNKKKEKLGFVPNIFDTSFYTQQIVCMVTVLVKQFFRY